MTHRISFHFLFIGIFFAFIGSVANAQTPITIITEERHQTIDGFGAFQGGNMVNQSWWQELFFEDLKASIYRVDLTPQLVSPYSDLSVYSPWFMGSSVNSVFNLEDQDNPNGPENNRVRTYTGPEDYSREFGGENAPIAVMGPDIEQNTTYFTYTENQAITEGQARMESLGDFKLIGSIWSPLPWLKVSSGNDYPENWWPGPVQGTPWPFVWGGNYAGGRLDVSGSPLDVFDDTALGGDGPTSSLTQFARSTAAYVKGYQDFHGVSFYAISIQNELNFEQFYNSATYPLSSQYIAALKAVRAEFDQHEDLQHIKIMGPEDLLGGEYGLWQYGGNNDPIHKNLQYLQNIGNDPEADAAIDFFCIHGYDTDGVSAGTANPVFWEYWKNGWTASLAPGIPPNVNGYADYGKKSWMTETSGEVSQWLYPENGFPGFGGWSVGLRIHQALSVGDQSAWIYWTFVEEGENGNASNFALSSPTLGSNAPKYVAAKHFFHPIRPNSVRISANTEANASILASAYLHEENNTLTIVALNTAAAPQNMSLQLPEFNDKDFVATTFSSQESSYWQEGSMSVVQGIGEAITLPAFSIISIIIDLEEATAIEEQLSQNEARYTLEVYPNPSSGTSQIQFTLPKKSMMTLTLNDLQGRLLRTIISQEKKTGPHLINYTFNDLPNGTYILKLTTTEGTQTQKLVVEN